MVKDLIYHSLEADDFGRRTTLVTSDRAFARTTLSETVIVSLFRIPLTAVTGCAVRVS